MERESTAKTFWFVISRTLIVSVFVFLLARLPFFELGKSVLLIFLSSLVVYLLVTVLEKKPFSIIGLKVSGKTGVKALITGTLIGGSLLIAAVLMQWMSGAIKFEQFLWDNKGTLILPLLGLIIQGGTAYWEEVIIRGYFLTILQEKISFIWAVFLSSILFAALHFIFTSFSLIAFVNLSLLGILCALALKYAGNIWAAIGVHFAWNWVQYFGFYIIRGREAQGILNFSENAGMHWILTGNLQFEIEATVFAVLVLLFGIWYLGRQTRYVISGNTYHKLRKEN